VAIIVPEMEKIKEWATESGKDWQAALRDQDADLKKLIMEEITSVGTLRKLNSLEKPKEIFIASDPFSVENDILTPTFKLKRNVGQKVYQAQIDVMYEELAKRGL
jgi:long-chain acyl-CoA synthetase